MREEDWPVCFRKKDYASVGRRVAALLIDHAVLGVLLLGCYFAVLWPPPDDVVLRIERAPSPEHQQKVLYDYIKSRQNPVVRAWLVCVLLYYVPLRRLRGGTLGYRVTRIRLVDAFGRAPGWMTLVKRFLVGALATMPLGATYLHCPRSTRRQALHDRFCGTWVVRCDAPAPAPATVVFRTRFIGTFPMTFIDIEPVDQDAPPAPAS